MLEDTSSDKKFISFFSFVSQKFFFPSLMFSNSMWNLAAFEVHKFFIILKTIFSEKAGKWKFVKPFFPMFPFFSRHLNK